MAKSRRVKHSKKSTRRAGAAKTRAKAKVTTVVEACRKVLGADTFNAAKKYHAEALKMFPEMTDVEKETLDLCLNGAQFAELRPEAEAGIEDLESAPSRSSTPETVETELKTITPDTSQEDMMMMDIDREPSPTDFKPMINAEEVPMELDGGRKRRKTRRGGKKRKTTRRH